MVHDTAHQSAGFWSACTPHTKFTAHQRQASIRSDGGESLVMVDWIIFTRYCREPGSRTSPGGLSPLGFRAACDVIAIQRCSPALDIEDKFVARAQA